MNKLICQVLFLFLSSSLLSNNGDSIRADKKQIGAVYAPEYAFRNLKWNADSKIFADVRDTLEIAKFGYSAGLTFAYQLNNKCTFEVGALFSDKGERTKKYDLQNSIIIAEQDKVPSTASFINHYYYLDIPLKFNYYLYIKKVKFHLTAGFSTNAFLYQKTTTTIENKDGSSETSSSFYHPNFKKINFSLLAGFGINYNLTDKYVLRVEPLYKRSINSIVEAPVKSYLYSFGLNVGIAYIF